MAEFKTLEQIFSMMQPLDLSGQPDLRLGSALASPLNEYGGPFERFSAALENTGRGVLTTEALINRLNEIGEKVKGDNPDYLKYSMSIHSTKGSLKFSNDDFNMYSLGKGPKKLSSVTEIVGQSFQPPEGFDFLIMCGYTPFFHPAMMHAKTIDIFLNSMPSTVVASMIPYLDIEFQVNHVPIDGLPYLSQLRFLLGNTVKPTDGPNKAMYEGHVLFKEQDKEQRELDFAGMELFTSPQTLVNPNPNGIVTGKGGQYSTILDPFRPFASIESLTINVRPTVGVMTFKTASLVIKLHDRSRLHEISDLIRPQAYGNVTLWLTYGWRAPDRPGQNPYFDFINNNMLMREAYGIQNVSFSFDNVGQAVIRLELFTRGGAELKTIPITRALTVEGKDSATAQIEKLKSLSEAIAKYRKQLKLDPEEGSSKEIRYFQVLDAASVGQFPDMKTSDVDAAIKQLESSFKRAKNVDVDTANKLIKSLKDMMGKSDKDQSRFALKDKIANLATQEIAEKFAETRMGPDPFLFDPDSKIGDLANDDLTIEIGKAMKVPTNDKKSWVRNVVSFGKLFSTFALTTIMGANICDELQVFFYVVNDQCGPVSGHSLANFPIDMESFLGQYTENVIRRGGEDLPLDEFLAFIVNSQLMDDRAIAYGLRSYYNPWDAKNPEPAVKKGLEKQFEQALSDRIAQYGPFKKPVVEMYVEVSHERVSEEGQADVLKSLQYSAKDISPDTLKDAKSRNARRIMRIHIYDKQVTPYREAAMLLRSADGAGFFDGPTASMVKKTRKDASGNLSELAATLKLLQDVQVKTGGNNGGAQSVQMAEFSNAAQIKALVSKMVPSITYGANGTTIINANLSTKADPLQSAVNMQRSKLAKNVSSPNGSGEGGIPLRVIPATLSMTTLGCPLARMAQNYFIDFNTGTSVDNLYICTQLTHTITNGKFETAWTFGFSDAYGVFEGAPNIVKRITELEADLKKPTK